MEEVVKTFLEEYKNAGNSKSLKSHVLNKVADALNQLDPPARFVRLEPKHQRWYEIEAFYSREKISQTFRDIAQEGYRSANTFKNLRRRRSSKPASSKEEDAAKDEEGESAQNKKLPPKKVAAKKAAAVNTGPESSIPPLSQIDKDNDLLVVGDVELQNAANTSSVLSRKEQLAMQIEQLQKEMAMLEEQDKKLKEADNSRKSHPIKLDSAVQVDDDNAEEMKAV